MKGSGETEFSEACQEFTFSSPAGFVAELVKKEAEAAAGQLHSSNERQSVIATSRGAATKLILSFSSKLACSVGARSVVLSPAEPVLRASSS